MYVKLKPYSNLVKDVLEIPKPIYDLLSKKPRHAEMVNYCDHTMYLIGNYVIPDILVQQTFDRLPLPDRSKLPTNPFFVP